MKRAPTQPAIADQLGLLAEPVRLRMLNVLEAEELAVGEVANVVQLPQSTASRHLKQLAEAGWLVRRHAGTATLYRLVLDDLDPALRALWVTVRGQMADAPDLEEDRRRLAGVLAERRTDSQAFFGRVAGAWDEVRSELFGEGFTAHALLGLVPGDWVVADIGCGTGNASEHLAPFVRRVLAVDLSEPMLDAARKRLTGMGNVEFRRGEATALPMRDGEADAAVCVLVLHHLPDPSAAVAEMARVLRPGGVALVVDMVEHLRDEYRHTMGHAHLGFSHERIGAMLEQAGFSQVRVHDLPRRGSAKGPGLLAARGTRRAGPD